MVPKLKKLSFIIMYPLDLSILEKINYTKLCSLEITTQTVIRNNFLWRYHPYKFTLDFDLIGRFNNLTDLRLVLKEIYLPASIFKQLSKLRYLYIDCYLLIGLDGSEITSLMYLNELHFFVRRVNHPDVTYANGFKQALSAYINKLICLKKLNLSNNTIVELNSDLIGNLSNLNELGLYDCDLKHICDSMMKNMKE